MYCNSCYYVGLCNIACQQYSALPRSFSHPRGPPRKSCLQPSGSKAPPFTARFWGVVVRATFFTKGSRFAVSAWTRAALAPWHEKSGLLFCPAVADGSRARDDDDSDLFTAPRSLSSPQLLRYKLVMFGRKQKMAKNAAAEQLFMNCNTSIILFSSSQMQTHVYATMV